MERVDSSQETEVIHRRLDDHGGDPTIAIAQIIAELEERPVEELETTWNCVDGVLNHVFSNPPSPAAQVDVSFSYEGYRITVEQNGRATFVKTGDPESD